MSEKPRATARAMVYDAEGVEVRAHDDWNGSPAITIGKNCDHVIYSREEAQALIDAIWKAGRTTKWTLYHPEPEEK
jgi:hypothetical protein